MESILVDRVDSIKIEVTDQCGDKHLITYSGFLMKIKNLLPYNKKKRYFHSVEN